MPRKKIKTHQTIIDIISHVLARDPVVQEFISEYNRNEGRLMQYVLEEILHNIDSLKPEEEKGKT